MCGALCQPSCAVQSKACLCVFVNELFCKDIDPSKHSSFHVGKILSAFSPLIINVSSEGIWLVHVGIQ